jgi:hypothetical protein
MKLLAPLLLLPALVLADVGMRSGGTYIGPVRDIDCARDGGLLCSRDAGTSIGSLRCNVASSTEPGCVAPTAQTWSGTKTITGGDFRLVGHTHAGLTACSSGLKGTWQTCTDHNAPVFCNGTANYELIGATSYETFPPIYVNGLLHANLFYLSDWTLPYAFTVTNVSGFIAGGAGTTQTLRFTDGVSNCDCSIACTGATNLTCSGGCTFSASTAVYSSIVSDGCTSPPTVKGVLTPAGYR